MRLNKNFANVYTPFHEFEEYPETTSARKMARLEKKEMRQAYRRQVLFSNSLTNENAFEK